MEIIIDAGATKTAFILLYDRGQEQGGFTGAGINPNYTETSEILRVFARFVKQYPESAHTDRVRYYGAGCASDANKQRMTELISSFFPLAEVYVYSDLMAVCHALSSGKRSIVGILGTGAASCLYDGEKIVTIAPSLGYMLGDEGSGTNLGKRLLTVYLTGMLDAGLRVQLETEHRLSRQSVIDRLYRQPSPNAFMASLAPFVRQHLDDAGMYALALQAFEDFFASQKYHFADAEMLDWNLSGSVAYHFQDVVREAAARQHCCIGEIVDAPLPKLAGAGRRGV
jgi:N-acetylglucosamine kinase-like BadF-type ATPase